jgi:hypothetical protein
MVRAARRRIMTDKSFDFVVITLLDSTTKSHEYKILVENGIQSVIDIALFDRYKLNTFTADTLDSNGDVIDPDVVMHIWKQNCVLIMADMICDMADNAGGITKVKEDNYLKITNVEWDEYCFQWKLKMNSKNTGIQNVTSSNKNNNNYNNTNSISQELQTFIRSIKKDRTQYKVLKDDKQFDNWQRSFLAVA